MTLQEAMNSKRKFRMKNSIDWLSIDKGGVIGTISGHAMQLTTRIMNADYEIEEKTYTVTEKQLRDAFSSVGTTSLSEDIFISLIAGMVE